MRLSQFTQLMHDEFTPEYAQVLTRDLVLGELGDRTAERALADGDDPRDIWLAICRTEGVPKERWTGKRAPKKPKAD